MYRAPRQPIKFRCLDTDRENANADYPVRRLKCVPIGARHPAFVPKIARKVRGVAIGLKTDEVVMTHGRNEALVVWKRSQNLRRWKRDMVEKPNLVAMTEVAKGLG
jgi:hypothetical protein